MRALLITLLLAVPWAAAAQALEQRPGSAASLALAGAGVTAVRDPSALWHNPACITRSSARVTVGLSLQTDGRSVHRTSAVINAPGGESRDAPGVRLAPSVALALPLWRRMLWVGLGYHLGFNHRSLFPPLSYTSGAAKTSPPTRQDRARYLGTELSLQQHLFSVGLAFRHRVLAVGLAVELSHLRLQHRRTLWAGLQADRDQLGEPELDLDARLEASGQISAGALVGLWIRPLPLLDLGLALRIPVTSRLEGTLELIPGAGLPQGHSSWAARGGAAELDWRTPLQLRGGLCFGKPWLRLHVELSWRRWSAASDPEARLRNSVVVAAPSAGGAPRSWPVRRLPLGLGPLNDQLSWRAGLESRLLSGFLTLRSGYAFHLGATPSERPSSVLLDLDRHVLTAGAEFTTGKLSLALALYHSFDAALDATGEQAKLHNPLDQSVTAAVGAGHYSTQVTRILLELKAGW